MSTIPTTPAVVIPQQLPPPPSSEHSVPPFVILSIIVASAVIVSTSVYAIIRCLSWRFRRTFAAAEDVVSSGYQCNAAAPAGFLDRLPLFAFGSVAGNLTGGDCAVCLSKFEPHDQLRLLPLCCHAFHAACIDTWIVANQTCPLCRSTVLPSDAEVRDKTVPRNGSFRVEIGSVSRSRREGAADGERRSYSIGSFDYVLDGSGYEVPAGSTDRDRRGLSDIEKELFVGIPMPEPPGYFLAAEVSGRRNWLSDYVDRLAFVSMPSRAMSFRSSGRFFSGSSRRNDVVFSAVEDPEASRLGEEISELFQWLSGI